MSASSPPRTFSTSARTVASPHSTRCSPQIHRSPGRLTGSAGGSGASSRSVVSSSVPARSRSSSASSKPSRSRSKASSFSAASSAASISSFQPALVAIWLSAIISARRCVGVRCDSTITGASDSPSLRAASTRPWPATITPSSPTSTGFTNPNSAIDPAICATCCLGMGAGIARVRDQSLERPPLDCVGKLRRHGSFDRVGVGLDGGNVEASQPARR